MQAELDGGADVMIQDWGGTTLLDDAANCLFCKLGAIQTLLAAGADGKAKNKEGKTPWDFAQDNEDLK